MKIALLITGDEILKGDLRDSNSYYLLQEFASAGLRVEKIVILGDDLQVLATEIKELSKNFELLIINGGLGSTSDDYTSQALGLAFDSKIIDNSEAKKQVIVALKKRGRKMGSVELKQAFIPKIAKPIYNEIGIAPGIFLQKNGCKIFCTPGVPSELYPMFINQILPQVINKEIIITTLLLRCFGVGESQAQQIIEQENFSEEGLKLGFRAHFPYIDIKLTGHKKKQKNLLEKKYQELKTMFSDYFLTSEPIGMEQEIVRLFTEKKKKLVFAESCTGGLLSSKITSVAGAADIFQAGYVLYQNEQKELHGVSQKALSKGAVSPDVVIEMLLTSLKKASADYGASVSGIAGPTGGSKEKPVGTVWVAWGTKQKISTKCLYIPRDRKTIQSLTTYTVLDLLRREILKIPHLDSYSFEKQV